jgi:peptide subunit release factor 1 (eRF1)
MDARTLSKLYALDGPFVTVYLNTRGDTEDAATQLETRWKNILRELGEQGIDAATTQALSQARGDHTNGGTRVLVAAHGTVQLALSLPQPPPTDHEITVGPLPRLVPLADALALHLPHLVVLADRTGAEVLAYTSGPEPAEQATSDNDRFPQRKTHAGGWAAKRYDNDVEETWEQSARDVAALIDRLARDIDARVVIASGDDRALQLIAQHLPTNLADRFTTIGGGGRHQDGSDELIAQEVLKTLADRVAADTVELLETFSQERGQHDRAADGVAPTIEALRKGQVRTLILTDARDTDRRGYGGSDATHLAESTPDLDAMGVTAYHEAPLDELLLRAAWGTGADVQFVTGGVEQSPAAGIGALLRYAD